MNTDRVPLNDPTPRKRRALHPVSLLGLVGLAGGLLAGLWLAEWRWAVTGLVVMLVLVIMGEALAERRGPLP